MNTMMKADALDEGRELVTRCVEGRSEGKGSEIGDAAP